MLKESFEFDLLDPCKVCAIVSTHLPKTGISQSSGADSNILYTSLLQRIKQLLSGHSESFTATKAELKLCEVLTAKGLLFSSLFYSIIYKHIFPSFIYDKHIQG